MANTLTALIPSIIGTIKETLRQTGAVLNFATLDAQASQAGKDQVVTLPESVALADGYDVAPGAVPPALLNSTVGSRTITIEKVRARRFHLTGDDTAKLRDQGAQYRSSAIAEAVAGLIHEMAAYHFGKLNVAAGLAFGAAATNPFASNVNIIEDIWEDLVNANSPSTDRLAVFAPRHWASIGKLAQFQKVNESGNVFNFATNTIQLLGSFASSYDQALTPGHVAGTAADYVTDGAVLAGVTKVKVKTGTLPFKAGDVVSFAADAVNKYVVAEDLTGAGDLKLTSPLRVAVADANAITAQASHRLSLFGNRRAAVLATRTPAQPEGGDVADAEAIIPDPVTGLAMRLAHYKGYHAGQWEVSIAYGSQVRRPELLRKLIGG
jgi:hypothetical protein